jgi:hypothetical protein
MDLKRPTHPDRPVPPEPGDLAGFFTLVHRDAGHRRRSGGTRLSHSIKAGDELPSELKGTSLLARPSKERPGGGRAVARADRAEVLVREDP